MKERVLVAMSGGVDSSVAAAILQEQGYEVIGGTMKIWPKESCGDRKDKVCCSLQDIEDARKVCALLKVRHYVLNLEDVFRKEVIDYFTNEYLRGRTPNPCIVCNEKIKFGALLRKAEELGCDYISTGHYARIERNGAYRLRESIDKSKDQSYVLFPLSNQNLQKVLFPIGGFTKDKIRQKAKELGFNNYKKSESQDICFVPEDGYAKFIKKYCGTGIREGNIVDTSGKILGTHKGFWNFTIGQRKGLGIAHRTPLYVINIDPGECIITVGDFSEVKKKRFVVALSTHRVCGQAEVKIRYNHKKAKAYLRHTGDGNVEVEFEEKQEAITPGQAAVFYDGEYVVGGGWIEKVLD